jgi:hypothetical protein
MKLRLILALLALAGCAPAAGIVQPADPAATARIVNACTASGLFKLVEGGVAMAVPAANLPIAVINAGVDKVCANPAAFAGDIATVKWVAKYLSATVSRDLAR